MGEAADAIHERCPNDFVACLPRRRSKDLHGFFSDTPQPRLKAADRRLSVDRFNVCLGKMSAAVSWGLPLVSRRTSSFPPHT